MGCSRPWLYEIRPQATLSALAVSRPDGRYLAYVTETALTIVDLDNANATVASEPFLSSFVAGLVWHPSQAILATANANRSVAVHHLNRDALRTDVVDVHDDAVNSCAFTATTLVSTGDDAIVRSVSLQTGAKDVVLRLKTAGVAIRAQDDRLLVAELNGAVHLLDDRAPGQPTTFQAPYPIVDADLAFPYVGVVTDRSIALYDLRRPVVPSLYRKVFISASMPCLQKIRFAGHDPKRFAVARADGVAIWDVDGDSPMATFVQKIAPTGLAWHPTRNLCYSGDDFQIHCWPIPEQS